MVAMSFAHRVGCPSLRATTSYKRTANIGTMSQAIALPDHTLTQSTTGVIRSITATALSQACLLMRYPPRDFLSCPPRADEVLPAHAVQRVRDHAARVGLVHAVVGELGLHADRREEVAQP